MKRSDIPILFGKAEHQISHPLDVPSPFKGGVGGGQLAKGNTRT